MKIRLKFINSSLIGLFSGLLGAGVWVLEHQKLPSLILEHPGYAFAFHVSIALVLGTLMRFFPTGYFNEEEIRTFNTLSVFKTIKWKDVTRTKRVNFPFIKYIFIYTASSKWALWVPLSITKENELLDIMSSSNNSVIKNSAKT